MYSFVLYATAWTLTGNWLTAIPTAVYFTFSRFDMTRVEFTVPLRERYAFQPKLTVQFCQKMSLTGQFWFKKLEFLKNCLTVESV